MKIPRRTRTPQTLFKYQFPESRPIFWGPNQLILEDGVYVEPSQWRYKELLVVPRVVRFIHDSSDVDSGTSGPEYIDSFCVIVNETSAIVGGMVRNEAFESFHAFEFGPTWASWTFDEYDALIADGALIHVVCTTDSYIVGYYIHDIALVNVGDFGTLAEMIDTVEYVARGFYHDPLTTTTYHYAGPIFNSIHVAGIACDPLGLEGGCH